MPSNSMQLRPGQTGICGPAEASGQNHQHQARGHQQGTPWSQGGRRHSAHTAPIITLFIPGIPLKTTCRRMYNQFKIAWGAEFRTLGPLASIRRKKKSLVYQQGLQGAEFRTLGSVATGGGKQPTYRTERAQRTLRPQGEGGDRVRRTHSHSPYPAPSATSSPHQHTPRPPNAPHGRKNREGPEETGQGERDDQGEITGQGRPRSPKLMQSAEQGEGEDKRERLIVVGRSPCQENYPADAHPSAHKSVLESANPAWTRSVHLVNGTGNSPSLGQPAPV